MQSRLVAPCSVSARDSVWIRVEFLGFAGACSYSPGHTAGYVPCHYTLVLQCVAGSTGSATSHSPLRLVHLGLLCIASHVWPIRALCNWFHSTSLLFHRAGLCRVQTPALYHTCRSLTTVIPDDGNPWLWSAGRDLVFGLANIISAQFHE